MAKHWTKYELEQRQATRAALTKPKLGWPEKPGRLPRDLSRKFDQIAMALHNRGILYSTDAPLIVRYCSEALTHTGTTEAMRQITAAWGSREPGKEPSVPFVGSGDHEALITEELLQVFGKAAELAGTHLILHPKSGEIYYLKPKPDSDDALEAILGQKVHCFTVSQAEVVRIRNRMWIQDISQYDCTGHVVDPRAGAPQPLE